MKRVTYTWNLNAIDGARGLLCCSRVYRFDYVMATIKVFNMREERE